MGGTNRISAFENLIRGCANGRILLETAMSPKLIKALASSFNTPADFQPSSSTPRGAKARRIRERTAVLSEARKMRTEFRSKDIADNLGLSSRSVGRYLFGMRWPCRHGRGAGNLGRVWLPCPEGPRPHLVVTEPQEDRQARVERERNAVFDVAGSMTVPFTSADVARIAGCGARNAGGYLGWLKWPCLSEATSKSPTIWMPLDYDPENCSVPVPVEPTLTPYQSRVLETAMHRRNRFRSAGIAREIGGTTTLAVGRALSVLGWPRHPDHRGCWLPRRHWEAHGIEGGRILALAA